MADSKSKKNPLYVVTNDGKDVEPAENLIDALIKKFALEPVIDFLKLIFQIIMENVGGAVAVDLIKGIMDEVVDSLEKVLKMVDPVLAFSFIKR
ncbi:MAG: hypothetical protein CME63_06180 [Halobacteriovoraceae bacterium]|nr:hypothetical protein [Halobacteriovoraceae bacterium]MBC97316.1 hypothetical protein [Halobacteriovoraceae bacterium]|tara:strand:- start:38674 stop:38955 length:282 start_codon:yes stop_codon:yes gene_type:complete